MTADIVLLPLPEADGFMETFDTYGCPVGSEDAWGEETVKETIRANVAHATEPLKAENERLRAERDSFQRVGIAAQARAERLAEALRELSQCDGSPANVLNAEVLAGRVRSIATKALLREQEVGNDH